MTHIDRILQITHKDRSERLNKILSLVKKPFVVQQGREVLNIVLPAKNQTNKVALVAHWDVFPGSYGYNDNSSGVSVLLSLQNQVPDNVEIVLTDKEEYGGRGSRMYLEEALSLKNPTSMPIFAINVDVVGLGNTVFSQHYGDGTISVVTPKWVKEVSYRIPFSDSYVLESFFVPNILLITGHSEKGLIREVFEAQHCGREDGNIDLLFNSTMELTATAILETIQLTEGAYNEPK